MTSQFTVLLALASLAFSSAATAYSFVPTPSNIRLSGPVTIVTPEGSETCTAKWRGKTGPSGGKKATISYALFASYNSQPCEVAGADGPWPLQITGPTTVALSSFALTGQLGNCGPGIVPITVDSSGVWSFDAKLPGGCRIKGSLPTDPPVTIGP